MPTMMWFRSDLRVNDNPALHAAASAKPDGLVAVFVITPDQWESHDMAPIRADFILRNLQSLSEKLSDLNIALRIIEQKRFEDVPGALLSLAKELECDRLCFNREYELNEKQRDEATEDLFREAGIQVDAFTDQCLFEPGDIRTGDGGFYKVYSPFKRSWIKSLREDTDRAQPLAKPKKQSKMLSKSDRVPSEVRGFSFEQTEHNNWEAGEAAAKKMLSAFLKHHADEYKSQRDLPALEATSKLSPYLVSGVISLRTCVHEAMEANNNQLAKGSPGLVHWISELIWREFYKHILVGFPRVSMHRPFQLETEQIEWKDNDEHFNAWCEGRTGYPIVDAAMRQLTQTGWMHNRLRMIVAMFFTKNLFLDWRRGERFFMRHLVDGDLAANNGGWQWSASTGTDAAPYFRIFNPISQSKKCDPDGEFIRRFVPELEDIEDDAIHEPNKLPSLLRSKLDYPEPIVDHSATRAEAIDAFKAIRD